MTDSTETRLWSDFERICDCGGRLSGTASEQAACGLLEDLGREATGVSARSMAVPYFGWRCDRSELTGPGGQVLDCHPLVRSAPTGPDGLEAEVLDLGRGTPDDFAAHGSEIPGRIVLVRHELMFSAGTIHRRLKYRAAVEAGAAGFLIAGPLPDSAVAGSSGRAAEPGIPAAGISQETAALLAPTSAGRPVVRLVLETTEAPSEVRNLFFDMPGQTDDWVVLSAHIDGHDMAESAIDNASGLASALAVARALSPRVAEARRGLRLALFNVEEWALTGSAVYVDTLTDAERDAIAINVNLDSVGVGERLTALTSGFAGMESFLLEQAKQTGVSLGLHRPLQMNSDHGNFARAGIPAFRLVAGFDDPAAATRLVLTNQDTRDKVDPASLAMAARYAQQVVAEALDAAPVDAAAWRRTA
jgi:Zn-dependent M28 family amino/carboxypeptidase